MKNSIFALIFPSLILSSCFKGENVDTIIHNASIHTLNMRNDVFEAMAIKDGKIIELGSEREILNKYSANNEVDAQKREIYPGLYDAHTHMFSYAEKKLSCDLTGSHSIEEVMAKVERFLAKHKIKVVVGFGWDQSLWENKTLPNNDSLSKLFPDISVLLYRIDGHALLANKKAIEQVQFPENGIVNGGQILLNEGLPTGVFLDNAMDLFRSVRPKIADQQMKKALLEAQEELLQYGITNINEAGITLKQLHILQELDKAGDLKLNIYAMLFPGEKEIAFARKVGIYKTKHLHVRSFKVIADGALGSRGACLSQCYADDSSNYGTLLQPLEYFKHVASIALETGYQMNVHCIGDSANHAILEIMGAAIQKQVDLRWRIEHAQIVNPKDVSLFQQFGIIPSVQPTHAVSDMRFVRQRLGEEREKWSYAYKSLLAANGIIALGTDFPVESMDPFLTIEAAVNRTNANGEPKHGYLKEEGLSLDDCIRGMTLWAALACFEENEQGTLEPFKDATFVILYNPLGDGYSYTNNYAKQVFNKGKSVYLFQ